MFSSTTKMDFSHIPLNETFRARIQICVSAHNDNQKDRPPLNLGLVIDHSGSMSGSKLDYVKMAAANLISKLSADDHYSLTIFDNTVDVLLPPTSHRTPLDYSSVIESIRPRGNTNLSGGYQKGFDMTLHKHATNSISRVILLTDGLANEGITDHQALTSISASFKAKSITTTTIGVGEDYDESLLGSIADSGGGNTYFIENPDDAPSVFKEEVGYLTSLSATNVQVGYISTLTGLKVTQLNNYQRSDAGYYDIGDIYSGQEKYLLLEVDIPPQAHVGPIELATLTVRYRDVNKEGVPEETVSHKVFVEVVSASDFTHIIPDKDVTLNAALLFIANTKAQMMKKANQGQFKAAAEIAEKAVEALRMLDLESDLVKREIQELIHRANELREHGADHYSGIEKKRMFYESEMMLKSRNVQYNQMRNRRRDTVDPNSVSRVLVFDIETTGLPKSYRVSPTDTKNWPHIVQIAWATFDVTGKQLSANSYIVKPEGYSIPASASAIHGITDAIANHSGQPLSLVLNEMNKALQGINLIVSHNLEFDLKVLLSAVYRIHQHPPHMQINGYCTMRGSKDFVQLPGRTGNKYPSLKELYEFLFHSPISGLHNAENDVQYCAKCYFEMVKQGMVTNFEQITLDRL